jgi:glycine oxidase
VTPGHDVIVVGGGAIGAASARELARAGHKVLVLDPGGDSGQAWKAAAGMLAPQIEADGADPLLAFGVAARDYYAPLATSLGSSTNIDIGLWQEGIARLASDPDEASELQAKVRSQVEQGYQATWLEANEVRARWPWLGSTAGALWSERDGALDPLQLVQALLADAGQHGAEIISDKAVAVEHSGGRISGVVGLERRYPASMVVVAAGAWSGQIAGLPRVLPVKPVRGQMAALPWPPGVGRAIVYHKDSYLLARGSEAILGSTMEQVGFEPRTTPEGIGQIFKATVALCPGLVRGKPRRTWAGLRPVTADGLPIIGPEPRLRGLWYATGHGRNGILLAGLTGLLVRQLIGGESLAADIAAFTPSRFD